MKELPMKKQIFSLTAAVFTVINLHAQGTVNFGTVGTGTGITNGFTGQPISGTAFRASLYYLPYVEGERRAEGQEEFILALRPDTISILPSGQIARWDTIHSQYDCARWDPPGSK